MISEVINICKLGRNDPCHCGSGIKYKKCCLSKDEAGNVTRVTSTTRHPSLQDEIEFELTWPNILHKKIATYFVNNTNGLYPEREISTVVKMWCDYANAVEPLTKKAGVFPAALEYILCQVYNHETSQSALARKYDVSATAVSQRANDIFYFLEQKLPAVSAEKAVVTTNPQMSMEREMMDISSHLENQQFETIEDANAFIQNLLNQKPAPAKSKKSRSKKEQAADLVYQAWNEPDAKKRTKLAQDAILLYPDSADAYNVLAESAALTLKEAAYSRLLLPAGHAGRRTGFGRGSLQGK